MSCLFATACAPSIRMDAPAIPVTCMIAPLDPPPALPDADRSPCPAGSGLAACFNPQQDAVRQSRFKILHDDRDYCRDAYDRARQRADGE